MNLQNVKITELTFEHIIRFIREVAIIGVLSFLCINVFSGGLSLDFTKLSPTELVGILLAFFSISLSAAFYFAATNASNKFYDNINKFNKDTSELLGRLDEQLKHVNTRQKELGDRIDKSYLNSSNGDDEQSSADNEKQIEDIQNKWQESLDKILNSATIEPEEKLKLETELKRKNAELSTLKEEQAKIEAKKTFSIKSYLKRRISEYGIDDAVVLKPDELLLNLLDMSKGIIFRRDLEKFGFLLTENPKSVDDVTDKGRKLVSDVMSRLIERET
ncbi:hypothetical protein ACU6U9_09185 [Pseudomonas sp. HK3]